MRTKQVIVMRTDLRNSNGQKLRTGKFVAQGSHASLGALLKCFRKYSTSDDTTIYQTEFGKDSVLNEWLNGIFTKVCLSVESEKELLDIYNSIPDEIPKALITDSGLTEFNGIPTNTCIGIGPWVSEEIDKYTKHLKLM